MDQSRVPYFGSWKVTAAPERAGGPVSRRMLAPIMIAFGVSLTIAWVAFLGYELVSLVPPLLSSVIG
jgi:hypothetical protein